MLREASLIATVLSLSMALPGQEDWRALRINEVIADNAGEPPVDVGGNTTAMIEIYNPTDSPIEIGTSDPATSLALTDSLELPHDDPSTPITEPGPYTFRPGLPIRGKGWVVVFCDDNWVQNLCEPHASFRISSAGDEPVTLWGPVVGHDDQGRPIREVIDRVWLPPLATDVSFGRYPDGAGPAPVPLDQTLETFSFHGPGTSTFGTCSNLANPCPVGNARTCLGKRNAPGSNIPPRIELLSASSKRPEAGEAVELRVRVEDERSPLPAAEGGAIARAQVRYRVDSGPTLLVDLVHDGQGIRHAPLVDALGNPIDPDPEDPDSGFAAGENPFGVWTEWTGVLPGQPAGARVEFHLFCEDSGDDGDPDTAGDNLTGTSPGSLCDEVYGDETTGPCAREFGGPGCDRDVEDVVRCYADDGDGEEGDGGGAAIEIFVDVRYVACNKWFTYQSGYGVREVLEGLLITEVVASQTKPLMDPTEADVACPWFNGSCRYDDLLELHNASRGTIDLAGLWLSRSPFEPREWRFPEGAAIDPGGYLVVWLDGDGGKCPCPSETPPDSVYCQRTEDHQPCFWRCPDPTDTRTASYHTSFSLQGHGEGSSREAALEECLDRCDDEERVVDCDGYCASALRDLPDRPSASARLRGVYLFDTEAHGFGLIHSVEWDDDLRLEADHSLSLYPDGSRDGQWILAADHGADPADGHVHGLRPSPGARNGGARFLRGDADEDGRLVVTDAVVVLSFLFLAGKEPSCLEAANANDDERLDISDGISILGYLFLGGPPPPSPGPPGGPCGPDPAESPSHLGCTSYAGC